MRIQKTAKAAVFGFGGSGEIRTHGGLSTLDGFQDRCIKPLCHASLEVLAETVGFEPTEDLHPQRISSPLHSASLPRFHQIKKYSRLAEAVRFELTEGYQPSTVFKTVALNRSATLPFLETRILMKSAAFAKVFLAGGF